MLAKHIGPSLCGGGGGVRGGNKRLAIIDTNRSIRSQKLPSSIINFNQLIDINCYQLGRSRKEPYLPQRGNLCHPKEGWVKKNIRFTSVVLGCPKRGRTHLPFPPWEEYGYFLEWPISLIT